MRLPRGFACGLLLLTACSKPAENPKISSRNPQAYSLSKRAGQAYSSGQYAEAMDLWTQADKIATESGDTTHALISRINLANCYLITFSYQKAMETYLNARELARQVGDKEREAVTSANIALLYGALGDFQRTIETGEEVLNALKPGPNPYRAMIYLHLGNSYHRLGRAAESDRYFRLATSEAEKTGNAKQLASALDHFGLAMLDRGETGAAEPLVSQALDIRTQSAAEDLMMSHRSIGVLRSRQGRPQEALPFLSLAIESQRTGGRQTPIYELYAERARAHLATGDETQALADFRTALGYARRWRLEILPAGMLPAHWEGGLNQLRSSFIRFAADRAIRTRDTGLAIEALAAAEESRLAGLRTSVPRPDSAELPSYQAKVQKLQALEASLLSRKAAPEAEAKLVRLRQEILDLESALALRGDAWIPPQDPVGLARQQIAAADPSSAIFSFFLDTPHSYLWVIRRGTVKLHRIPAREPLEQAAREFRAAIEAGHPEPSLVGYQLYTQIFGEISPESRTSRVWTLVLDGNLFETPWAALPTSQAVPARYLAERNVLRTVPSLFLSADKCPEGGRFVGVGDPIYNRADSRLKNPAAPSMEFARLVGSGAEVETCARAWNQEATVLRGPDATPARLMRELSTPVAALHFATHFVRSAQDGRRTLIALGLSPGASESPLLGPEQILAIGARPGLVVLSGCQSGAGQVIAGAGLMGLTRSWLAGGASNVTASLWPTPDDQGALFQSFYRHYSSAVERRQPFAAATSLRAAQLDMLHSPDWRSSPRYWAAFFLVSKG